EGSHWAAHRALLKDLVKQAKWEGSYTLPATSAPGPFIASEVTSTTDARTIKLYTAVSAGHGMEAVVVSPTGGGELTAALLPMLERTTIKNPPEKPKRPEVVESYRRPNMKKFLNADGTTYYASLRYERMVFLSNGV